MHKKTCTKCDTQKHIHCFSRNKYMKDGFRSQCKTCDAKYVKNNTNKISEYKKKYQQNNKEIISKKRAKYRAGNKDKIALQQKIYADKNREKLAEKTKIYSKTNKGIASKKNNNSKRRSLFKDGDVTTQQLMDIEQKSTKCYWCGNRLAKGKTHVDHYEPLSKGGKHTLSNLVVSCSHCNLTKQAKDPRLFAQKMGKLL